MRRRLHLRHLLGCLAIGLAALGAGGCSSPPGGHAIDGHGAPVDGASMKEAMAPAKEGGVDGPSPFDAGPADARGPHVLYHIELAPQSPVLFSCQGGAPATQTFAVTGFFRDGTSSDVTSMVSSWKVAMPSIGALGSGSTANVFTTSGTAGFTEIDATVPVGASTPLKTGTILTSVPEQCVGTPPTPVDFFFVAPYAHAPAPASASLQFSTTITQADLVFLVDSTGSMGAKIMAIQSSLSSMAADVATKVSDLAMGVGDFFSWPCPPDGAPGEGDEPFVLLNRVITVQHGGLSNIQNAIAGMVASGGADASEDDFDALYLAVTGEGTSACMASVPRFDPSSAPGGYPGEEQGTIGGMGFRTGSLPIFLLVSDAEMHDADDPNDVGFYGQAGAHGHISTAAALNASGARVIGIASSGGGCNNGTTFVGSCTDMGNEPYPQMVWLAENTGAVVPPTAFGTSCAAGQCCTDASAGGTTFNPIPPDASGDCPLAFKLDSTGAATTLSTAVETAVIALVKYGNLAVTTKVLGDTVDESGNPLPAGHTTADFFLPISSLKGVTTDHAKPDVGTAGGPTSKTTTAFLGCPPGVDVFFDVKPYNDFIAQDLQPHFFKATIEVFGNSVTKLDSRDVYILVPPASNPIK